MNLKKFVQKLDSLVAGVFVEGPRNGAQKVVSDLQKDGPIWSGQYSNSWQIEGLGKSLFSKIEGDKDTIMGLPIKRIKEYLKNLVD